MAHWLTRPLFIPFLFLYGGGAILIREAVRRWGRGWPTLLVLGVAYAILEEGLMTKAFFDPYWIGLGTTAGYGRWVGVNWVWDFGMLIYHGLISIVIPIVLVGLLFPARRAEAWVGRRMQIVLGVLLLAVVVFGFLVFTGRPPGTPDGVAVPPYRPPVIPYLAAVAALVALVLCAKRLPVVPRSAPLDTPPAARPVWFYLLGLGSMVLFYVVCFELPQIDIAGLRPHPVLAILAEAGLVALGIRLAWRMTRGGCAWTDNRALAIVAGALTPFIFGAVASVTTGGEKRGMVFVGIAWMAFLIVLRTAIRRRKTSNAVTK